MKRLIFLIIPLLFLSSCSIDWNDEKEKKISDLEKQLLSNSIQFSSGAGQYSSGFYDKGLGISFNYNGVFNEGNIPKIEGSSYVVQHVSLGFDNYIQILPVPTGVTVETVIKNAIRSKGKDPEKCKIINDGPFWGNQEYDMYRIDTINKEINYSQDELKEIKEANDIAKEDGGPFGGEWKKQQIHNMHLIKTCSEYANPLGLGTSKSTPSIFVYNKAQTIVFLPGLTDPGFYIPESIRLFTPSE